MVAVSDDADAADVANTSAHAKVRTRSQAARRVRVMPVVAFTDDWSCQRLSQQPGGKGAKSRPKLDHAAWQLRPLSAKPRTFLSVTDPTTELKSGVAPHLPRRVGDEFQLPPLVVFGQKVALHGRREPALRAEREPFERHVPARLVDATTQVVL